MAFGAETAKLTVDLSLAGNFQSGLAKSQSALTNFDARLSRTTGRASKAFSNLGRSLKSVATGPLGLVGVTGGAVAAAYAFKNVVTAAGDFEAELKTINTIARESDDGLSKIGDGLRQLAREGRGDLSDLAEGYYDILSAGVDAAHAQDVLRAATTLAIGGLSTNAEAVDLLTTAINAYGQSASQAQADADLFAKAIEIGKVKADEIAASFANIAPLAAQQGIEIKEVAAAYGALTAQGVPAAEVTTQMSRAILDLLSPNKELNALQEKTGKSFIKLAREKGLVVALQTMRDATKGDEQAFKDLFGRVEGYKFALQTTGPQQKIYNDALRDMGDAAGTASEQMAERTKGFNFQMARLGRNINDVAITIGNELLPVLGDLADEGFKWISENQDKIKDFAKSFGGVVRGAVEIGKMAIGIAGNIADAWNLIPAPMRDLLVKGFVADRTIKFLFGFSPVGSLLGGVTKGLGSALVGAGIGNAFVQKVWVVNMPLGGLGGGGGLPTGLLPAAGGLTAAGAALTVGTLILAPAAVAALGIAITNALDPTHERSDRGRAETATRRGVPDSNNRNLIKIGRGLDRPSTVGPAADAARAAIELAGQKQVTAIETMKGNMAADLADQTHAISIAGMDGVAASKEAGNTAATAALSAGQTVAAAIRGMPPPIVQVNVTPTTITHTSTTINRYGPDGGSRSRDGDRPLTTGPGS